MIVKVRRKQKSGTRPLRERRLSVHKRDTLSACPQRRNLSGALPLVLQILRDQVDQLGRQREQLLRRVPARAELLVERTRQDARAGGAIELRHAGGRIGGGL